VKVGRLAGDPGEKAREFGIAGEGSGIVACLGQFLVGKGGVERAVADRVNRPSLAPAARLGNGVVLFDAASERAAT
jgi:hypothetical protein